MSDDFYEQIAEVFDDNFADMVRAMDGKCLHQDDSDDFRVCWLKDGHAGIHDFAIPKDLRTTLESK